MDKSKILAIIQDEVAAKQNALYNLQGSKEIETQLSRAATILIAKRDKASKKLKDLSTQVCALDKELRNMQYIYRFKNTTGDEMEWRKNTGHPDMINYEKQIKEKVAKLDALKRTFSMKLFTEDNLTKAFFEEFLRELKSI